MGGNAPGGPRVRVLLAKLGLDSHTIGVTVIARALRDAGMEVIYSGLKQTPEMVAATAIQEDVDVVGLSSLSAAHMQHFPRVVELLREQGADDVIVFGGGIIPKDDIPKLEEAGITGVFTPGTPMQKIVDWVRENVPERT